MSEPVAIQTSSRAKSEPHPLPPDIVLAERFEIERTIGRGGFGIAYLARDIKRGDYVVVKELAPAGIHRTSDGIVDLESLGKDQAHRLRQRFLEEARTLGRLNVSGVPSVRARFTELGTAFYVCEHFDGAITLEHAIQRDGRMDVDAALDILYQLMETVEGIHASGILHRDIKPANILLCKGGEVTLIDFGAAREWHADVTLHNTILFTPGYAPLEQLTERGKRGPGTDIYSLCATLYHMLTGMLPPSAADRVMGTPLPPIRSIRPEVDATAARAIEAGLGLKLDERPHTIEAFRDLLSEADESVADVQLETYDARLLQIQRLNVERRECPSCGDVLEDPRRLRRGACPVCHDGTIAKHVFDARLCPECKAGALKPFDNASAQAVCPKCSLGWLQKRRKSRFVREWVWDCADCGAVYERADGALFAIDPERGEDDEQEAPTPTARLRRANTIYRCDGCGAQYDLLDDGRVKQIVPPPATQYVALHPEEWARVAAGKSPGSGNAFCSACDADYFVDGEQITLLGAHEDLSGFASEHAGRLLSWEDIRWLGVGKESPHPGVTCKSCKTEFDREGMYLRLVRSHHRRLRRHMSEPHTLEDWHRIANGLPQVNEEVEFLSRFDAVLAQAYRDGTVDFDSRREAVWRGPASSDEERKGTLVVTRTEVPFGGMWRRWRVPIDAIEHAFGDDMTLRLTLSGEASPVEFHVEEIELTASLPSGKRTILLGPEDLAARINVEAHRSAAQAV